jgi:hypothetical protein
VISGAAMFVRGAAMKEVGLLDEAFFFYGEETDWCHRFGRKGWELRLCADPGDHAFRQRCGGQAEPPRDVLMTEGTTRLHRKHGGLVGGADLLRDPCRAQRLARGVLGGAGAGGKPGARARARHFARVVTDLPRAWPQRRAGMKVLLIAPNVDATDVGEALMAFKWAEALSTRVELTVLCFQRPGRPTSRRSLPECARRHMARARLGDAARAAERDAEAGMAGLRAACAAMDRNGRGASDEGFDITHQLMPQAARYASPLRHFDLPYIIGPLGGALDTPDAFRAEAQRAGIHPAARAG